MATDGAGGVVRGGPSDSDVREVSSSLLATVTFREQREQLGELGFRGVLRYCRCPHFRGVLREVSSFQGVLREVSSFQGVLERCPHFRVSLERCP